MAGFRRKKGGKAGFENPYCGPSYSSPHTCEHFVNASKPEQETKRVKRQLVFSFLAVKPINWAGFQGKPSVKWREWVEYLETSLITFKEKEISFQFSQIDCVIKISNT